MKILHVIYSLRYGGAERVVVDLARALTRKGHVNRISLIVPINRFEDELEDGDVNITCESLLNDASKKFTPRIPLLARKLQATVAAFKPDVVHCSLAPDSALCGLLRGVPVVRTLQNSRPLLVLPGTSLPTRMIMWLAQRSLISVNMHVVACCTPAATATQEFLSRHGKPSAVVIRNGVDLERITRSATTDRTGEAQGVRIITIGTLWKDKNQGMTVMALRELLNQGIDAHLWILGNGVAKASIEKLVLDLGMRHRVHFVESCSHPGEYLSRASLYWCPSISEGCSIAILEAMSLGIPVVATDVDGNRDLLAPWPDLRVVVDDYRAMASVSAGLLRDEPRRVTVGRAMRQHVTTQFTAHRMADDYIRFYRQAIGTRRVVGRA